MTIRHEGLVTSLSWIPTEAIEGAQRLAFDSGITHYDPPPPTESMDVEQLRDADRFRFANELRAFIERGRRRTDRRLRLPRGRAHGVDHGQSRRSEAPLPGRAAARRAARARARGGLGPLRPDLRRPTGVPAPRRVRRRPFVQWQAPLVWTTLALTIHADGRTEQELIGASRFPRHWVYDADNRLSHKSGLTDFKDWYRKSFGKHSPWGDEDSEALVSCGRVGPGDRALVPADAGQRQASHRAVSGRHRPLQGGRARHRGSARSSTGSSGWSGTASAWPSTGRARCSVNGPTSRVAPAHRATSR